MTTTAAMKRIAGNDTATALLSLADAHRRAAMTADPVTAERHYDMAVEREMRAAQAMGGE